MLPTVFHKILEAKSFGAKKNPTKAREMDLGWNLQPGPPTSWDSTACALHLNKGRTRAAVEEEAQKGREEEVGQ